MLMHFDKSPVHHYGVQLKLAGQAVEQLLKDAGFSPAAEPLIHRVPFPKLRGQVAPRSSGAGNSQNTFNRNPICLQRWPAALDGVALQSRLQPRPLPVR